jgi:ppGpp synthetase/RelA/SpoT-type nucleotidyltranferase
LIDSDLKSLDEYRRSFGEAYATVVQTIREQLHLEPTGRPAKSTTSIIDKLRRESIRLTQIQDVAGCRIIVADVAEQERVVMSLSAAFPTATVVDRRAKPSHGYRAVHIIVSVAAKLVEIQIRTFMQHVWAETSEKLADTIDPGLKYGEGPETYKVMLTHASRGVQAVEFLESTLMKSNERSEESRQLLLEAREELRGIMNEIVSSVGSQEP